MSRIAAIDPSTASNTVKPLLEGVEKGLGLVPNLFRVAAQSPASLEALVSMFGATAKTHFSAREREAIALAVSEANGCDYCLSAHTLLGKGAGLTEGAIDAAREARSDEPRLAAVLALARSIVDRRGRIGENDVVAARAAGLGDPEIVDVVTNVVLTIFTNYLNEVAKTDIDFPLVTHKAR
ncbi:MAG TPA: carboxymuconolactone decarboxylase family protein [Polyangiaceae bacterium]|jgi:uncharacterized peroxidase-related enzyme